MAFEPTPVSTAGVPTLLIVTMGEDYTAPARMPGELKAAGFSVALLAPKNALATHTRFVDKIGYFPENPTVFEWIRTLAGAVRAVQPDLLLPGDDTTLLLLMQLVLEPPAVLRGEVQAELAALITCSLGDPAHYLTSIDKTRLFAWARDHGVHVPPGDPVDDEASAIDVAATVGYPVIVRPALGTAGAGVAVCDNVAALRAAMRDLPARTGWVPSGGKRALVQRVISGQKANHAAVAWRGREVAGFTREQLQSSAPPLGAGSVSRYAANPQLAAINGRLLAGFGATGFVGVEYLIEQTTGEAHVIEINRRMVPATHTGRRVGVDLAAAFASAFAGNEWRGPTDVPPEAERTLALFPQEWLRDPTSRYLKNLPTDAPWDDPHLFVAMLRIA
jgi:predicted ATP-grasp superfamily ATP-dependent carboligase